jgi:hypothetical protein
VHDRYVLTGALKTTIAAILMGGVVWLVTRQLDGQSIYLVALAGIAVGGVSFFLLAFLLKIEEARSIPRMILRRGRG